MNDRKLKYNAFLSTFTSLYRLFFVRQQKLEDDDHLEQEIEKAIQEEDIMELRSQLQDI